MSTGLELVPIALAIGAVVAARRRDRGSLHAAVDAPQVQTFSTRMRDPVLLSMAVVATGGRMFGERNGLLYGALGTTALVLAPDIDGVFEVHIDAGLPETDAQAVVAAVDRAYGIQVQQQTYRRVTERVGDHGLTLESEYVDSDDSIVLSLRIAELGR